GLHHRETGQPSHHFQRQGGGAASRPEVEPHKRPLGYVSSRRQRFNQQTIDRLIGQILQRQRREIDFVVPARQQSVVLLELFQNRGGHVNVRLLPPFDDPIAKLPR